VRVEVDTTQTLEQKDELWLGDCVELFFSAGADLKQNSQVIVAPGIDPDHPTKHELIITTPGASPKPFPVKTIAQRTASGYVVEFVLPWSAFGVTPEVGQKCAIQVLVDHREPGGFQQIAWYPSAETSGHPERTVTLVLGENASPSVDSLARVMALTPREGQVSFTLAPDALNGHVLTVQHKGEILYRHEITQGIPSLVDFFPLPREWNSEPVVVCDNQKVLATLTQDKVVAQIKQMGHDLIYGFGQGVFTDKEFPGGGFGQDAFVRRFFAPLKVTTKFYDAQYNEVTRAEKPGRYGAIVQIQLPDGTETKKFITLYRLSQKINWRFGPFPISAELPPGTGLDPAVLRNQSAEISETIKTGFTSGGKNNDLAVLLAGLSETKAGDPPVKRVGAEARDIEWWYGLRQHLGLVDDYQYVIDLPADYDADPNKKWPLIVFLHGSGDGVQIRKNGLPRLMEMGKQLPAIVISPESITHEWWQVPNLSHFLDTVSAKYRIDPDRISVTGFSMGGFGTWTLALAFPDRFAAIAPVSGGGDPADAARLVHLPTWVFHGMKDPIVPPALAIDMIDAIRKAGGHPHSTLFPDVDHSCAKAYNTEALYTWLLAQKRGQPEVKTPGLPTP